MLPARRRALWVVLGVVAVAALAIFWLWPAPPPPAPEKEPAPVIAEADASVEDAGENALTAEVVHESALDEDDPWDDDGGIDYDQDDFEEAAEDDEEPEVLEPVTVAGVVLQSNGQPAGGAQLHLEPGAFPRVVHSGPVDQIADAKGHFSFEKVVGSAGSLHARSKDEAADVALELPLEKPMRVKLAASGAIDVTVVGRTHHPIGGLTVRLSGKDELSRALITAGDGTAHFESVAAGSWEPTLVKYNASYQVQVQPGQRAAVTMQVEHELEIVGRVVSEAGPLYRLVVDADMVDAGWHDDGKSGARTDGDGGFAIPVRPGKWVLTTHHPKWGYARAMVDAPGPPVELRLAPPAALEGTVVDHNGAAAPGFVVRVAPTASEVADSLEDRTSLADGRFKFSRLPPGETVVEATRDGDGRKTRVTVGLTSGRVTEITLRLPGGSRLKGRAVDEHGKPLSRVFIDASWDDKGGVTSTMGGQDGEFSFESLPGDKVELYAMKEGYAKTLVKDVAVPQERYELVMRKAAMVSGHVVDATGQPVPKFAIDGRVFEDADGSFDFEPRSPGLWALTLEVPGLGQSLWAYEVNEGVSTDLGTLTVLPRPKLKLLLRGMPCEHCGGMLHLGPGQTRLVGLHRAVFEDQPRLGGPLGFNFDSQTEAELPPVATDGFSLWAGGSVGGALWQHVYPLSPGLDVVEITAGSP